MNLLSLVSVPTALVQTHNSNTDSTHPVTSLTHAAVYCHHSYRDDLLQHRGQHGALQT